MQARAFFWLRLGLAGRSSRSAACWRCRLRARVLGLPDDGTLVRLALLGIVATACSGTAAALLQTRGAFGRMSVLTVTNTGLTALLAIALWLMGQLTIVTALVVLGAATSMLTAALGFWLIPNRPPLRPSLADVRAEAGPLFRIGRWLWLSGVLVMLAANLDVLILNYWATPAVVGAYALALSVASKVNVVNHSLYTVLLPGLGELRDRTAARLFLRHSLARSGLAGVVLLAAIPLAEPFILIAYGADYAPAVGLLQLLLVVSIVDVVSAPLRLLPLAFGRARLVTAAEAARVIALASVALALVPAFGAVGAVVARLLARLAGVLVVIGGVRGLRPATDAPAIACTRTSDTLDRA